MPTEGQINQLTEVFRLTPYQSYMLANNGYKYNLDKLVKRADVLYAPYKCNLSVGIKDWCLKVLFGPKADLIGADRLLLQGIRGIKLYPTGFYKFGHENGQTLYSDSQGNLLNKKVFKRIIRL